jgi:aldehyde:ferredoxin oxidoreductase
MAELFHRYGTTLGLGALLAGGATPVKNWSGDKGDFPLSRLRKLREKVIASRVIRDYGCSGCPVRCGGEVRAKEGEAPRPEYEVLGSLGPLLLNDDLDVIIEVYHLCNLFGLDVIETGTAIAWAIESFERGKLSTEDTGGVDLKWGDGPAILKLAQLIAFGYGIGELLSHGVARTSQQLGGEEWAVHVGGQAPGMWRPAYDPYYGLAYISDPTPGRHTAGSAIWGSSWGDGFPLKGITAAGRAPGERQSLWSNFIQVVNSLGLCLFYLDLGEISLPELILAATGRSYLNAELLETGRRIQSLRRLFNLREGFPPQDPCLHHRLKIGLEADVEAWRSQYFRAMGWSPEGRPALKV